MLPTSPSANLVLQKLPEELQNSGVCGHGHLQALECRWALLYLQTGRPEHGHGPS